MTRRKKTTPWVQFPLRCNKDALTGKGVKSDSKRTALCFLPTRYIQRHHVRCVHPPSHQTPMHTCRPRQIIRVRRPNPSSVGCPCSFWHATENARRHPPISRMACKHACDQTMESVRIASMWGKGAGKGTCSRYCCSTWFSRWYCVWPRNIPFLMQQSRTTWCSSNKRTRKGRKRAHYAQAKSTDEGGIRWRCRGCEVCCTRTIRASYRDHQKGWRG